MTSARDLAPLFETLTERYGLAAPAVQKLQLLFEILVNDPSAPTSIRDPQKVLEDHLADALVALELDELRAATDIVDIGSGAGLPGLPLAIALPEARVMLLESASRKAAFIDGAIRRCELANAEAVHGRAEAWVAGRGRFDAVTARALAPLEVVVEYAAPLLRPGGALVAWRGRRDEEGETAAAAAARELGMEPREVRRVCPYPTAQHRHLHVVDKVAETPAGFPRRPGLALKRPLGH